MPKTILYIGFIIVLCQAFYGFSQPPINERYIVDDENFSVFSSVISTDSCYYVSGMQGTEAGFYNYNSAFIKFGFDGEIENLSIIENDTIGISFMPQSKMIHTHDGNFVHIAVAVIGEPMFSFMFIKMSPNGDTLATKYYSEFFDEDVNVGKNPSTIIENADGTFYCLVHIQNDDTHLGGLIFFRIDQDGNLMYRQNYFAESMETYNSLRDASMVQISENRFIIGAGYRKDYGYTEDKRQHTKIMVVDSLGEILDEYIYWDDLLSLDCHGLTKTIDEGLLYCGRLGTYNAEHNTIRYIERIIKLNNEFEEEWKIELGEPTIPYYIDLVKIKAINDSEFVAVGHYTTLADLQTGVLIKFNLSGEKIWERRYRKIPPFGMDLAEHQLFDVDLTPDNGFVMVGQAINYNEPEEMPGQKGWLVKTDSFGCLVPGCEFINIGIAENDYQSTPIYPNPATNYIFYYHHQNQFQPVEVKIYSASGQIVQAWSINSNDITCEVDISHFEKGMYFLSVTGENGQVLETQRFVKE